MKPQVKIDLSELDRLRDTEKNYYNEIEKLEKKFIRFKKDATLIYTSIRCGGRDLLTVYTKNDLVIELNKQIEILEKRPKRCILF